MYDISYAKEYKERLETSLEQISSLDDKIAYVEKQLFYVEVDDCWDDKDRVEHCVLVEKKRELITLKNK